MSGVEETVRARPPDIPEPGEAFAEVVAARNEWLAGATAALGAARRVHGVVLVGSLAHGDDDAFSDVDLIVAVEAPIPPMLLVDLFAGLGLPGVELYRRPKPRNAPAGGAYLAVALELAGLPVLVDLYLWPATTAAVPAGGRMLFERDRLPRSELGLLGLLATCPPADDTGSDPDDPATLLLQVQLAAKYHARGDQPRRAGICRQLQISDICHAGELRQLLDTRLPALRPLPAAALTAVDRLLHLVSVSLKEVPVTTSHAVQELTPQAARQQLVDLLRSRGWITRPEVAAAFAAVPRHLFAPDGTSLEAAYADSVVITKRGPDGKTSSSISAPWLQAYMIEAAGLRAGSRVLEIGSGGYNAALLAEVVGPAGTVVSIDIDADVVANARAALTGAGYPQVQVIRADGEHGQAAGGPYDGVIVTVETSDIPPAWIEQLAPGGVLVVPFRLRGHTRCLTLRPAGDHLVAMAALQCGFVPMQGHGRDPVRRVPLRGDAAVLVLDDPTTQVDGDALRAALDGPSVQEWSPVTAAMGDGAAFEAVHLWVASQPRPYGVLTVDRDKTAVLLDPQDRFCCPTLLTAGSFAYLTLRKQDAETWQFGAHAFGPDATALVADLIDLLTAWDRLHRAGPGPQITVHPAGTRLPETTRLRLLVPRHHTLTAITWPGGDQ
ncbi:methyltransferase, FxLD system [Actinoplanes sp. NPDC026619]|uniref:methyltransferase, FxLD system n=1 Tax=Actinoplanes sp. NPDC026619 TaxID=3155798 RepID=UPI0033F0EDE4